MVTKYRQKGGHSAWVTPWNVAGILLMGINMIILFRCNYICTTAINSDMSSEMVLAKLLAEDGGLLSKRWVYSTELRVFNTQIVMSILFRFFSNWSLVRAIGNTILYAMAYLSAIFMVSQLNISKGKCLLPATLILLPFSDYQWNILLMGAFYIPHITFSFLIIGCILRFLYHSHEKLNRKMIGGGVIACLSFAAGMGGARYLLIIFAPLVLVEIWNLWEEVSKGSINLKRTVCIGCSVVMGGLGYLVYSKILPNYYTFSSNEDLSFLDIFDKDIGERLVGVIVGTLKDNFGYFNGYKRVFSIYGVANACAFTCILVIIASSIYVYRHYLHVDSPYGLYFKFMLCNVLLNYFVFIFTDRAFDGKLFIARYAGPVLVHCFIVVFIYLDNVSEKIYQHSVCAVLTGSLVFLSVLHVREIYAPGANTRDGSLNYIQEQNMKFGYATFWNANVATELTDGAVEIASVKDFYSMEIFYWLMPKEYVNTDYAEEKCFVLLTVQEYEESAGSEVLLGGTKEYEDDFFVVYTYPCSKTIYDLAGQSHN